MLIQGSSIADNILKRLSERKEVLKTLAIISVDASLASKSFITQKRKVAERLGILCEVYELESDEQFICETILRLNQDDKVGGIIVQLPLPQSVSREKIVNCIDPRKDIDALTREAHVLAPTVLAVQEIFQYLHIPYKNMNIAVIGKGMLVGKPITAWLQKQNINIVVTDYDSLDIEAVKKADIVITGVGQAHFLKGEHIKHGSVLIDFGYAKVNDKTHGDVDVESCSNIAAFITPTPGGTGPIVVATLMQNFFELAS